MPKDPGLVIRRGKSAGRASTLSKRSAKIFGVTRERMRQIEEKALA
jgi:DNA-directed RNA polymerase sigma subunit (sigma70/sigma32)